MPSAMTITDFRKKIFAVGNWVATKKLPVYVSSNGSDLFKVSPVEPEDSPQARAKYIIENILPKIGGIWKDVPQSEFDRVSDYFRGPKAKAYMRNLRNKWN